MSSVAPFDLSSRHVEFIDLSINIYSDWLCECNKNVVEIIWNKWFNEMRWKQMKNNDKIEVSSVFSQLRHNCAATERPHI